MGVVTGSICKLPANQAKAYGVAPARRSSKLGRAAVHSGVEEQSPPSLLHPPRSLDFSLCCFYHSLPPHLPTPHQTRVAACLLHQRADPTVRCAVPAHRFETVRFSHPAARRLPSIYPRPTTSTCSTLQYSTPLRLTLPAAPLPLRPCANGARPSRPPRLPRRSASPARAGTRPSSAGARPRPPPRPARARPRGTRTARRRRLGLRARHLLRRRRRLRNHGRRVRVREPLQHGLRLQHGGAQHGALQQRPQLRGLLRGALRPGRHRGRRAARMPARIHRRHRHQLLPAQLRAGLRRRRLVQPAPGPLRHGAARLPAHRALPGWHCASLLPQGGVPEEGRHPLHHQRPLLLQPRPRHQRRGPGGRARGRRQVRPLGGVAGALPQLGPELAEQRAARRPSPLLPRHRRRRPLRRLQQRRAARLVIRPDLQRRPVLMQSRLQRPKCSCYLVVVVVGIPPDWSVLGSTMVLWCGSSSSTTFSGDRLVAGS